MTRRPFAVTIAAVLVAISTSTGAYHLTLRVLRRGGQA